MNYLQGLLQNLSNWAESALLTEATWIQLAVFIGCLAVSLVLARRPSGIISEYLERKQLPRLVHSLLHGIRATVPALLTLLLIWLYLPLAARYTWPVELIRVAATLTAAWVVIRFLSVFIQQKALARWLAWGIWLIAALHILELLDPAATMLEGLAIKFGETRISLWMILKGLAALGAFLWLAMIISRLAEQRLHAVTHLTPSQQVLFGKIIKISLIALAIVIAINTIGIDLTAFTVFSGALGLGVGFGLQKVISNFISGIILLLDRSIKPGDVIALGNTYGWVNALSARHVSVITRDGKETLIPNELLITDKVENWSYSSNNIRVKIPVGVSYHSDIHLALQLLKDAAAECERVMREPAPNALVREFGDSSVNLELRIWINDPVNGMGNIQSEVMLSIWDKFHEHGIEIPFPQRDIHLKSMPEPLPQQGQGE